MPAFMTIGTLPDASASIYSIVETLEDFKGDATAGWHENWIMVSSFNVEMKDEERERSWSGGQDPKKAARGGSAGRSANGSSENSESSAGPEERRNTLTITKPTDSVSTRIMAWTQSQDHHDIQIDCCTTEEEWPYLTMIFKGAFPTRTEIQEEPNDTITFQWKRAIVLAYEFDSSGEYKVTDIAEFGDVEESSGTTTADQRGLASFIAPPPNPHDGAEKGAAAQAMTHALTGGLPPVDAESHSYDLERRRLIMEDIGSLSFDLESVRGFERLSQLFSYDLEMRSSEVTLDPADIIGHEVKFKIDDERTPEIDGVEPRPRYFSGIVSSILAGEMASNQRRRYHAVVVPKLWVLTQRTNCRVFQGETVKQIVESVFGDASFTDYDISGVTRE
ncbi:MAG: contractile injection system protein, VgrG/Pvc8 family, partial [Planctomycetota bacterium]